MAHVEGQWSMGRILRHRLLPLVLFVLAIVFIAMGCDTNIQVESGNPGTTVELIAEFDGVKVYRINAGLHGSMYVVTRSEGSVAVSKQ
jgi:hypothetical protein